MSAAHAKREPVVAGRFYESEPDVCRREVERLCAETAQLPDDLPAALYGALVPHAGWVCSGRIAAQTLRVLQQHTRAQTLLITGSVHTVDLRGPALDAAAQWSTPLGDVAVDTDLRQALAGLDDFEVLDRAHTHEHSVEVQLPFIQALWGEAVRIVPCMIGPDDRAASWGERIGKLLAAWLQPVAVICSVDLTHYGPNYGFTPAGFGDEGSRWAHEENDRRLLDRIESLDAGRIVEETRTHHNSCGGGAIAAALAACRTLGALRGRVLEHTNSARELERIGYHDRDNSVGYAGAVFG